MAKLIQIPGPPVGYTDLMDYEIQAKLEEEKAQYRSGEKQRYFPLRPSAAGYCSRRLAYELMEYYGHADYDKPTFDPNVYRLLDLGGTIEYAVLRHFSLVKLVNVKYKQQVIRCFKLKELDEETKQQAIEGSCDLCLMSEQYKCIMDVKSVKDGFSKAYPTRWVETLEKYKKMKSVVTISDTAFYVPDVLKFIDEIGDDFIVDNIKQLNLYACTQFMKDSGIDHASIYKYNKNDSNHYELRFKPSDELAKQIEDKYNEIYHKVAKKKPETVRAEHTLGSMRCAFCWCNKLCWPQDDAKKAWFKTMPKRKWPKDIDRLKRAEDLKDLFYAYEALETSITDRANLEQKINLILEEEKVNKVKLENGHVYELKYLKSPKPHFELRRSKL